MVFSSITFIFFFLPVFLAAYLLTPLRFKNHVLLAFSVLFYTVGEGVFFFLMLASIGSNYVFGRVLARLEGRRATAFFALAVGGNLALLGFFKYLNFVTATLAETLPALGLPAVEPTAIHLPLGISFYTFQCISYIADVYRREVTPEPRLVRFATYIAMFPHLVAGPIVRYAEIRGELAGRRTTLAYFAQGVRFFIMGLAQKVLIANLVATAADAIFSRPLHLLSASTAWLGVACYTLQIYFDFLGYSIMAIGLALMMGFHFPRNFNYPYISRSITEFWQRWHMTLSRWFRDYLYIPMGGNRKGAARTCLNLLVVFILCGLWHGANWTFLIWGLYHGAFLVLERLGLKPLLDRLPAPLSLAYALTAVMVGWVFFRADSLPHALDYLAVMFGRGEASPHALGPGFYLTADVALAFAAGVLLATPVHGWFTARAAALAARPGYGWTAPALHLLSTAALLGLFALSLISLAAGTHNPFIYFRF